MRFCLILAKFQYSSNNKQRVDLGICFRHSVLKENRRNIYKKKEQRRGNGGREGGGGGGGQGKGNS